MDQALVAIFRFLGLGSVLALRISAMGTIRQYAIGDQETRRGCGMTKRTGARVGAVGRGVKIWEIHKPCQAVVVRYPSYCRSLQK